MLALANPMTSTPSLNDLPFEADPRREWTPPRMDTPEHLWDTPRTAMSSPGANPWSIQLTKPEIRPWTDSRLQPDKGRAKQPNPSPATPNQTAPLETGRPVSNRHSSPKRVVCSESSASQLPSVPITTVGRGHVITSCSSPSPPQQGAATTTTTTITSNGNTTTTDNANSASSRRATLSMAAQAALAPDVEPPLGGSGALQMPLLQSIQDPIDAYLARFQLHQRIRTAFQVKEDEHRKTVRRLGARIQAMTESCRAVEEAHRATHGSSGRTSRAAAARAGAVTGAGAKAAGAPAGTDSEGEVAAAPGQQQLQQQPGQRPILTSSIPRSPRSRPPTATSAHPSSLPEPPLGRNRFASLPSPPLPSAIAATAASTDPNHPSRITGGRARTDTGVLESSPHTHEASPSIAGNPVAAAAAIVAAGLASGASTNSAGAAGGSPRSGGVTHGSSSSYPSAAAQQGAYLALPNGSFAGTAPLRGVPTTEGLLFERYSRRHQVEDLPELQLRYLRPPGAMVPRHQSRPLKRVPRQPQPPARALPNGIPASRLEGLSARRRSHSPPKLYQQSPPTRRPEPVLLSGEVATAALPSLSPSPSASPPRSRSRSPVSASTSPPRETTATGGGGSGGPHGPSRSGSFLEHGGRGGSGVADRGVAAGHAQLTATTSTTNTTSTSPPYSSPKGLSRGAAATTITPASTAAGAAASTPASAPATAAAAAASAPPTAGATGGSSSHGAPARGGTPANNTTASSTAAGADAGGGGGSGGTLAQYLAVTTVPGSGEPLLDENFYDVLQQHFRSAAVQQTQQLRAHLNVNLPAVLQAMNCVNVTERPPLSAMQQQMKRQQTRETQTGARRQSSETQTLEMRGAETQTAVTASTETQTAQGGGLRSSFGRRGGGLGSREGGRSGSGEGGKRSSA
ncbi:hypothetical protein Agub_g10895 [Astrephomene gubernaculifera]|uniref:Uncharacterized protein n=1 Tax=Astrephomene gubernaculifera TaxID=47775 RepID=A0AAD3HPJ9_9CHLO|nr:hypothetical protein Agub_g10895 [Astrephomene gubernaculifera]